MKKLRKFFTKTKRSDSGIGGESYFAVIDGQVFELSRLDYLDRGGK